MGEKLKERFWEIDFLRGIAIIMMVTYHLLYSLHYFGHYPIQVYSGFWMYFARVTAITFIFLVGVSLSISFFRVNQEKRTGLFLKYFQRGLKIFSWGLMITLVTWFFLREGYIVFGILHLIGISIILAYPFLKIHFWNLPLGLLCILMGIYSKNVVVDFTWLLWLGFRPPHFYTLDYFPLLPWFGVVLIGIFCGNLLYPGYNRQFHLKDFSSFPPVKFLCFLGQYSLLIYLLHQPLIIIILNLMGISKVPLF